MRLIDADHLKNKLGAWWDKRDEIFAEMIDECPTVNPQEPKFIAKSDETIEQIKNCDECVFKKEWEKIGKLLSVVLEKQTQQEPKTGHWIKQDSTRKPLYGWYFCSECNSVIGGKTKFCSNCGAKMVESQESEDKE